MLFRIQVLLVLSLCPFIASAAQLSQVCAIGQDCHGLVECDSSTPSSNDCRRLAMSRSPSERQDILERIRQGGWAEMSTQSSRFIPENVWNKIKYCFANVGLFCANDNNTGSCRDYLDNSLLISGESVCIGIGPSRGSWPGTSVEQVQSENSERPIDTLEGLLRVLNQ